MRFEDAVAARRSVRSFEDKAVPREAVRRAVALAVTAPAPHHSSPWRFALLEERRDKAELARRMGTKWTEDLLADGLPEAEVETIIRRSHELLTSTPLLTVCCADMSRSHEYRDERRKLAEWSLFAHSVGAALQTYMTSLAADGVASCWISAPVFCRAEVQDYLGLAPHVEPHALVLAGYADPAYSPRPRAATDVQDYLIRPDSLSRRE